MINLQFFKKVLAFMLGIVIVSSIILILNNKQNTIQNQLTYLSQPIASEKVLITSAGQSTDTYIIKDVANDLLLENIFIPNAESSDLDGVKSVVIVVAHSYIGEFLHDIDYEDEYMRVQELVEDAQAKELPIIGVYIGGQMRNHKKTKQLIDLVFSSSSYNFFVGEDHNLATQLSLETDVPMIYVDSMQQIKGPFSSLFR